MSGHDRASYYRGIRAAVAWLHARALEMNDMHARAVLNSAAFHLGQDKPDIVGDLASATQTSGVLGAGAPSATPDGATDPGGTQND